MVYTQLTHISRRNNFHLLHLLLITLRNQLAYLNCEIWLLKFQRRFVLIRISAVRTTCLERKLRRIFLLLTLSLLPFGNPFLENTFTIKLSPYQISNSRYLYNTPTTSFPHKHLQQFTIITFLNIYIKITDIWWYLYSEIVKHSHCTVKICYRKYSFIIWINMS